MNNKAIDIAFYLWAVASVALGIAGMLGFFLA